MIITQYHCDACGKFVQKAKAIFKHDKHTSKKLIFCPECYRISDYYKGVVYTQIPLKV